MQVEGRAYVLIACIYIAVSYSYVFMYVCMYCSCCLNRMNNSYLGTIFPNETERLYLAGRTELYLCGFCDHTYRFPRYNNVAKVKAAW